MTEEEIFKILDKIISGMTYALWTAIILFIVGITLWAIGWWLLAIPPVFLLFYVVGTIDDGGVHNLKENISKDVQLVKSMFKK